MAKEFGSKRSYKMNKAMIKLAYVADFADENGEYELANNADQIICQAQVFDALQELFSPTDPKASWWNRMVRGWRSGKFGKPLGMVMAIAAERTKLNKKIEERLAPMKAFQEHVGILHDKIKAGAENYHSGDFKEELRSLNSSLKEMVKLVNSRDLRKELDLRNRLNSQQIKAFERIKGYPPEELEKLKRLLSPEAQSAAATPPKKEELNDWLKVVVTKKQLPEYGATAEDINIFRSFFNMYSQNPVAIIEFFNDPANQKVRDDGEAKFGSAFNDMLFFAKDRIFNDKKAAKKEKIQEEEQRYKVELQKIRFDRLKKMKESLSEKERVDAQKEMSKQEKELFSDENKPEAKSPPRSEATAPISTVEMSNPSSGQTTLDVQDKPAARSNRKKTPTSPEPLVSKKEPEQLELFSKPASLILDRGLRRLVRTNALKRF